MSELESKLQSPERGDDKARAPYRSLSQQYRFRVLEPGNPFPIRVSTQPGEAIFYWRLEKREGKSAAIYIIERIDSARR